MRPLELRLRNFRSFFGDGHVFDFRDRRLIGIVGPIGAGKSSILDAIAFALYGRTPRIARSTKTLIHQRADNAAVALRFEIDGDIWEAVRQLRRSGASQHALYRLEEDIPDAEQYAEKIVLEGEVNERIEQLLGFDFDAFGRSVLLAQGQFAEFLTSRPAERDKVLKGVFGHERIDAMRELAKQKAKESDHELEKLAIRLEQAEAATGRIAGRQQAREAAEQRREALTAARPEIEELTSSISAAETRSKTASDRLADLGRLAEKMPDPGRSDEAITLAERSRQRRRELAKDLERAHEAAGAAEASLKSDEFLERSARFKNAAELVVRLEALQDKAVEAKQHAETAATRHADALAVQASGAQAVESADGALASASAFSVEATKRLEVSEQSLIDARHADMASSLRAELTSGDTCPVCDQPVHELPDMDGSPATGLAEYAVAEARGARSEAEAALRDATGAAQTARASAEAADKRVAETAAETEQLATAQAGADGAVVDGLAEIAGLLGAGNPAERLEDERVAIDQLGADVEAARKQVEDIRRDLDEAITAEQESDRALGDLRTQVVSLAAQLDSSSAVPDEDPGALREALVALRSTWRDVTEALEASVGTDRADVIAHRGRLAELSETLGFEGSISEAIASLNAEVALLAKEILADEQLVAAAADLIAEREQQESTAASYRRLAGDLTDAKFIRFLLDEERAALAELGSDHFQRLSSGRYRFSDDGSFQVVDLTAADAIRKADSLSGGETFLASLGLALGLSEMVGRTGGRLDAFFLDEGFGTLDVEHLDLAMEGIEALVTERAARLVVVVSHVAELRHRLEDLIVLDKDPVTGDSVRVSGALG